MPVSGPVSSSSWMPGRLELRGERHQLGRVAGQPLELVHGQDHRLAGGGARPAVLTGRPLGPAALHPVEEQLAAAECPGLQDRDRSSRQPAGEPGFAAGLLPAQPAVAVLDREHPAAP
jgi:hypothetical protein